MNKIAVLILSPLLLVCFTTTVQAGSIESRFKELDRNRDGAISKSEAAQEPALWSRFSSYDQDKDGKLSIREFTNYARQ
ncbi:calcium-binding protein [Pseudoalteromonas sp. T1lg48]|uniref:calcium-binding protein n=1 Tax=Pseudoalteromonas sp. T1lg48 TaxID=2077100 RepID=UPI000CF5F2FC|nr:calcium-binding protein [Pseudoalteromonas sp. T1lg48]